MSKPPTITDFPVGEVYEVEFGNELFHLKFDSETSMTQTGVTGPNKGFDEVERITVTRLRLGVFLVTWQESSGTTVVQVQDYDELLAYTHITIPDDDGTVFLRFEGEMRRVERSDRGP